MMSGKESAECDGETPALGGGDETKPPFELSQLMPKIPHEFVAAKLDGSWPVFRQKHQDGKIESVDTKDVNLQGKFDHRRLIFTFSSGESLSVIVRSQMMPNLAMMPPSISDVLGKAFSKEKIEGRIKAQLQQYETEASFYERFGGKCIPGLPLLKVHYVHIAQEGQEKKDAVEAELPPTMLVMEDFTQVAREFRWAWDGEEALRNITRALASLHLMCLNGSDWKDGLKDYVDHRQSRSFLTGGDPQEPANVLMEKEKESFGKPLRHLRKATSWEFYKFALKDYPQQIGLLEVLVHGSLEPSSVLVSRADTSNVYAFTDFQSIAVGCPMIDLAHILHASTNVDNRRAVEAEMLALYYGELSKGVGKSDRGLAFSLEDLTVAYRLCKAGYALIGAMCAYSYMNHTHLARMAAARGGGGGKEGGGCSEILEEMRNGLIARLAESIETLREHAPEWLADD